MIKTSHISLLFLVIIIVLTTGCATSDTPLTFFNHPLLSCEVKNVTMTSPIGGVATLNIDKPGEYDITVRTIYRSKSIVAVGYGYVTNEPKTDRFGSVDNLVYHKWDLGIANHLGITDNNHILESSFQIPNESIEQKLLFIVYDENVPTVISLRKHDCYSTEMVIND